MNSGVVTDLGGPNYDLGAHFPEYARYRVKVRPPG
jgi:hypothetical protein